jgi:hypothetical protein
MCDILGKASYCASSFQRAGDCPPYLRRRVHGVALSRRLCQPPSLERIFYAVCVRRRDVSQNGAAGTLATQTGRPEAERAGANESNALQFISALTALCDR